MTAVPGAHPALPVSPDQLASDARAVVDAGADEIHIHPHNARGAESLEPQVLTPLLKTLRAAIPGVPISVATALSAEPDPWRRYDLVQRWGEMPDPATVNLHEPGSVEIARLLIDRRVGVEAGLATPDSARILAATGLADDLAATLVEPTQATTEDALTNASTIDSVLDRAGIDFPRMLHGADDTAWPLLDAAAATGRDLRIGLEDTMHGPDRTEAENNAALIALTVERTAATPAHGPGACGRHRDCIAQLQLRYPIRVAHPIQRPLGRRPPHCRQRLSLRTQPQRAANLGHNHAGVIVGEIVEGLDHAGRLPAGRQPSYPARHEGPQRPRLVPTPDNRVLHPNVASEPITANARSRPSLRRKRELAP